METNNPTIISGYASVFHEKDLQGDVVLPGAFADSVNKFYSSNKDIVFLWQHKQDCPIGKIIEMCEDGHGLLIKAKILTNIKYGKEATELIKSKIIWGLSIGFVTEKSKQLDNCRLIYQANLWEVSIVTFPANPKAGLLL